MAKQKGIIPIQGTIGNITFYKSGEDYLVKGKGGVDGKRIANDPAFKRTRENGAEFARAGKAGKLIRTALRSVIQHSSDKKMVGRLTREFMKVIQADQTSGRGLRNVIDGEAELLTGFEFNLNGTLTTTLLAPYVSNIDRVSGESKVEFTDLVPAKMIASPGGSTHFRIFSAGVEIDFEKRSYTVRSKNSPVMKVDDLAPVIVSLDNQVTANSAHPLFIALGIEFFQEVNGVQYPLLNGSFNAMAIVNVSGS